MTSSNLNVLDVDQLRVFSTRTSKTMLENELYSTGVELFEGFDSGPEEIFSKVEGAAAAAMRSLESPQSLTDHQRFDLAVFLALQHARVPHVIAEKIPSDPFGMEHLLRLAIGDKQPANLQDLASRDYMRNQYEPDSLNKFLGGVGVYNGLERSLMFDHLLKGVFGLAARVYRRQWTVLTTRSILFLGDDPVPITPLGSMTLKTQGQVTAHDTPVPIGPHLLLLIGDRRNGRHSIEPADSEFYAGLSNEVQLRKARRFLVTPPPPNTKISIEAGETP